jgi:hypothetical protein
MKRNKRTIFYIITAIFILNCSSYSREIRMELQGAAYCLSSNVLYKAPTPTIEEFRGYMNDPILRSRYSQKAIKIAAAYGFANTLKSHTELLAKKDNLTALEKEKFRDIEMIIMKRMNLIFIDIDSIASEMSCYVDRFSEILAVMGEKEEDIESSNTIYAIMSGALAAIIDGLTIYDNSTNQKIIIGGGLLVSYFSYLAFKPMVTVEFRPRSTNLKDIWFNPEITNNYSSALWFLLTKRINPEDEQPYRELLINRWIQNKYLGEEEEREKLVDLFFGKGGVSTITNLTHRKEMITQLKTIITLFEQDTRALMVEFIK